MADSPVLTEAERVLAEATAGSSASPVADPTFTLELNQDQKDIRDCGARFRRGRRSPRRGGVG